MENKIFYIRYLTYQPVKIETAYTWDGEKRVRPLTTVAHLIEAFQTLPNSPLASNFVDHIDLFSCNDGEETIHNSRDSLTVLGENGSFQESLIIRSINNANQINFFLSNTLGDIKKAIYKSSSKIEIKRNHPKTPKVVGRWEGFITEAASYEYPSTPIGADIRLPPTSEIKFKFERDVYNAVSNNLDNFNRIFRDEGISCRFECTFSDFPLNPNPDTTPQTENSNKFIGNPDQVLILDSKVLTFVEVKTPNDLPVRHSVTGKLFDLLEMYQEDIQFQHSEGIIRKDIGRTDILTLIEHVYGYLTLNNMKYGCVTCYDVTYFLMRPQKDTLLISHPIFNGLRSPSLLQAFYYFVQLVLKDYAIKQLALHSSSTQKDTDILVQTASSKEMDTDDPTQSHLESDTNSVKNSIDSMNKKLKFDLDLDSLFSGTVLGYGATGQVIRLKDSNIVVKHCDSYNNPDGFEMLKNEILVYEKLSKLDLEYIPRYYGECEFYGQYFIALDYIPGKHCDWRSDSKLKKKVKLIFRDLKSHGVVHQDLRPENVLLTIKGDIKLIDFGKADIK